jgi:hypothetical protein
MGAGLVWAMCDKKSCRFESIAVKVNDISIAKVFFQNNS